MQTAWAWRSDRLDGEALALGAGVELLDPGAAGRPSSGAPRGARAARTRRGVRDPARGAALASFQALAQAVGRLDIQELARAVTGRHAGAGCARAGNPLSPVGKRALSAYDPDTVLSWPPAYAGERPLALRPAGQDHPARTGGAVVADASVSDLLIFLVVLALRLLVPLGIPRYPLPAILAAFVLDGLDQTVFQRFTALDLEFYQGYDKALDVYYLTLAYIATIRNWANLVAFEVSRFLLYYRLVGVVLFELSQLRPILLLFPNTFEYFFDFYEGVRLRWDPRRLSRNAVIAAAALIWIVIKLPAGVHPPRRPGGHDGLDQGHHLRRGGLRLVGGGARQPPGGDRGARPGGRGPHPRGAVAVHPPAAPADHPPQLAADPIPAAVAERSARRAVAPGPFRLTDPAVGEKVALVSLVAIIFAQVLPGVEAGVLSVALGVLFVIVANAVLSTWLTRFGLTRVSTLRQFVALAAVNAALIGLYAVLLPGRGSRSTSGPRSSSPCC